VAGGEKIATGKLIIPTKVLKYHWQGDSRIPISFQLNNFSVLLEFVFSAPSSTSSCASSKKDATCSFPERKTTTKNNEEGGIHKTF
jgi:hypothetical protein